MLETPCAATLAANSFRYMAGLPGPVSLSEYKSVSGPLSSQIRSLHERWFEKLRDRLVEGTDCCAHPPIVFG